MAGKVRDQIEALSSKYVDLVNSRQYDKVVELFTVDATLMPNGVAPLTGREKIAAFVEEYLSAVFELHHEQTTFFELMSDNTAFSTEHFLTRDSRGKTSSLMLANILWRKVDGQWLINREVLNNRPMPPSPESEARAQIEAKNKVLYDAFNSDNIDAALALYAEEALIMPNQADIVRGKEAIRALMKVMIPPLKNLDGNELIYFELLNDRRAYSTCNIKSTDPEGNIKAVFRDCLLWTKINDEWYILRDMFNERPMPTK